MVLKRKLLRVLNRQIPFYKVAFVIMIFVIPTASILIYDCIDGRNENYGITKFSLPEMAQLNDDLTRQYSPSRSNSFILGGGFELVVAGESNEDTDKVWFSAYDLSNNERDFKSSSWSTYKDLWCEGGDFDDDGLDEYFVVFITSDDRMLYQLYDDNNHPHVRLQSQWESTTGVFSDVSIAKGYINNDNYADVAVVCEKNGYTTIIIFEGSASGLIRRYYKRFSGFVEPDVVIGEFDRDGKEIYDEIIVTTTKMGYSALRTITFNYKTDFTDFEIIDKSYTTYHLGYIRTVSAACGDVDNDGLMELVAIGSPHKGTDTVGLIIDDLDHEQCVIRAFRANTGGANHHVDVQNWDDDLGAEIAFIYSVRTKVYLQIIDDGESGFKGYPAYVSEESKQNNDLDYFQLELDADDIPDRILGYPQVIFTQADRDMYLDVAVVGYHEGNKQVYVYNYGWNAEKDILKFCDKKSLQSCYTLKPHLTHGNFNGDGELIQLKQVNLIRTEPVILALVSAPPINLDEDITNNVGICGTTIGWEHTHETTEGDTYYAGETITVSADLTCRIPFFGSAGFKLSASQEFQWTRSDTGTDTTTDAYEFAFGPGEHGVVFEVLDVIEFTYIIVSTNEEVFIRRIISQTTTASALSYFLEEFNNAANAKSYLKLKDYFSGDTGQISSFLTKTEWENAYKHKIRNGYAATYTKMVRTPENTGVTNLYLYQSHQDETTIQHEWGASLGVETIIGRGSISAVVGGGGGFVDATMNSDGFYAFGTIGSISHDKYDKHSYKVQMFFYDAMIRGTGGVKNTFKVIDYNVENYYGNL